MAVKSMVRSIKISDFTGGRNTLNSVNEISSNQHSAGKNVWTEFKALTKRRGGTARAVTISSKTLAPRQFLNTSLAASSLTRLLFTADEPDTESQYLCRTDNGTSFNFAAYTVGTCSTSGSSTTITGSGTAWLANVAVSDRFISGSATIDLCS